MWRRSPDRRNSCRSFSMSVSMPRFLISNRPMLRWQSGAQAALVERQYLADGKARKRGVRDDAVASEIADAWRDRG